MALTVQQVPYSGPYASDKTKKPHSGPTVEALKRAVARAGYMPWKEDFTESWPHDGQFDRAWRNWERDRGLPGDGVYGRQEWKVMRGYKVPAGRPHAGEYALDKYARSLIQKDWDEQNVPDEEDVRAAITKFCVIAEGNEDNWWYHMVRPLDVTVDPAASYVVADCSMFVIQAYNWAGQETGVRVPDPSKQGYSGYGNTDQWERSHPHVFAPYKVGDLAHYRGPRTNHVTICRRGGDAETAIWTSMGEDAGPDPVSLYYRSGSRGLDFVVRPPLMP